MKNNMKLLGVFLTIVGALGVLFFLGLSLKIIPLSITETSCSSEGVWIKFVFYDEPSIPQCFFGSITCYGKTPTGKTMQMGGYTATKDSTQKINCPPYSGKSFVGGYIPNEGQGGDYTVTCTGKDDATGKSFSVTRSVYANCPTFKDKCIDGTAINTCSKNKPYYCDRYGNLVQKPSRCGCPDGTIYNSIDLVCEVPKPQPNPNICANQPTSCPKGQHISKNENGCNICVIDPIEDPKPKQNTTQQPQQNTTQQPQQNTTQQPQQNTTQQPQQTQLFNDISIYLSNLSNTELLLHMVLSLVVLFIGLSIYKGGIL